MNPGVLVHILAKDKAPVLPLYLETLLDWDYPKKDLTLYIRTNNNSDETADILTRWVEEHGDKYGFIYADFDDLPENIEDYGVHEWNDMRLGVIRRLRDEGLQLARDTDADFYFTSDVDNFLLPNTLSALVKAEKPVISPLLHYATDPDEVCDNPFANEWYANFGNIVNDIGDVLDNEDYYPLWRGDNPGIHPVDLVHATYLIRKDALNVASFADEADGCPWDYITLCRNFRRGNVQQYLDNRQIYGCMTLAENEPASRRYMKSLGWQR